MEEFNNEFANPDPRDPSQNHSGNSNPTDGDNWITEEDVEALQMERDIMGDDVVRQSERILAESLPMVVHSIVKLARSAQSETVRLNAGKYIVDRNLGKIQDPDTTDRDKLKELYEDVIVTSSLAQFDD